MTEKSLRNLFHLLKSTCQLWTLLASTRVFKLLALRIMRIFGFYVFDQPQNVSRHLVKSETLRDYFMML